MNNNILIIVEGSTDLYFVSEFLKKYLEFYLPDKKIEYKKDVSRDPVIEAVLDSQVSTIYFKNAVSSNLKTFTQNIEEHESVEKAYGFEPRTFSVIYSLFDLDFGSTSQENFEKYLELIESRELTPILSYPIFEAEVFSFYFTEISNNWEKIKNEEVYREKINSKIYFENNIFKFDKNNTNIGKFLKYFRKDLFSKKLNNVCSKEKNIKEKIKDSDIYSNLIFKKKMTSNYKFYLEEQKEIYNKIIEKNNNIYPMIVFFIAVFEEIKNLIK